MLALAGRFGVMLDIDDFHRFAKEIPVLANIKPLGKYLVICGVAWWSLIQSHVLNGGFLLCWWHACNIA